MSLSARFLEGASLLFYDKAASLGVCKKMCLIPKDDITSAAIKPIQTEDDYEAALLQIESLMDAEADTPEANELEVLARLVELYEEKHFPIDGTDPIAAIRFRMEQAG
jgi:hypothetical protein